MKKLLASLLIVSSLFILIYSCSKDEINSSGGGSGSTVRTTISGMVLDENNAAVNNVTVTAYSQTATTNQYGVFVLKDVNVDKKRCIVQFSKAGYFNRAHAFIGTANTVNYVRVVMISNAQTHTLNATAGGTVTLPDNSSVQFAPNSFVTATGIAYTGTVSLTVKHLSPDAANFGFMIPGGDLAGENLNGENVSLYTYGMLGVELKGSSGEALQLAAGTTATLTMTIAASQQATAPATIPLWFFDDATSLWKEEGTATKVGNNYVGMVAHFSWWNCDYPGPRAFVKGKVVDCEGTPVSNIVVTIDGNWNTITDQNGIYQNWIPSGYTFTIQVLAIYNPGLVQNSQVEIISVLSPNQVFVVPDLVVPCPTRVAGIIKTCNGENTPGGVLLSNSSGFYYYQYTLTGSFNLMALPNAQLELRAYNAFNTHHQTITSLTAPNILNVGNLFLCDTLTSSDNSFILNGGPFTNQLITMDNNSLIEGSIIWNSTINIYMAGAASSGFFINNFNMSVCPLLGNCATLVLNIFMTDSNGKDYDIEPGPFFISTNVTQIDSIGGRIKGSYYGDCWIYSDSLSVQGYISGSFDVKRQ
ncbi:MAG: carboxypeptidase-like regulatory domain-containing protein [Bacteroidia bacterium]